MSDGDLAIRSGKRLLPDPSRVIARLFVPGQELVGGSESRASAVAGRVLALDEADVDRALADITRRFGARHRQLTDTFRQHADRISGHIADADMSEAQRLLLGATFTHEYSIEGAALCNPCMVADPDQREAPPGGLRFVMSVRGIGEGHRSSIGFRTGTVHADRTVSVDNPGPTSLVASVTSGSLDRDVFHGKLVEFGEDGESAAYVLDALAERFEEEDLERSLLRLWSQHDTRQNAEDTISRLRAIASHSYTAHFPPATDISERVLWPATAAESHGMEDARFVRFVDDDGAVTYYATYTAFDGVSIVQQLLETTDFVTFSVSPIVGSAAANKGLALFPRRIGGHLAALSRHDHETNSVAFSDNPCRWDRAVPVQLPRQPWEMIQLGNCGSPIETSEGWLVLTHGVGPMRTYSIGAVLLDLEDPTRIIASLSEPLLSPSADDQDGYVPNVVYSCGALVHADTLVVPYGIADTAIGMATVPITDLMAAFDHRPRRSRAKQIAAEAKSEEEAREVPHREAQ
ncbi:MAG TPA: glycoside hydrolase family 130 protein [Acidimicrobiales bacterium]